MSQEDWISTGLDLLVESGADGLTIEALCRRMGKSKGSFYHHFEGRQGYQQALLDHWKRTHTQELITLTPPVTTNASLAELHRLAQALPLERESAFRRWAQHSAKVAGVVKEVDLARVDHLQSLYLANGHPQAEAETLAWLEYCFFLGAVQLGNTFPAEQRKLARKYFEQGAQR